MTELNNHELQLIKGGSWIGVLLGIASGITFIIGILDGFVRPLKCNK